MKLKHSRCVLRAVACLALSVLIGFPIQSLAQERRSINVGRQLYSTGAAFTNDRINWPRNAPTMDGSMMNFYGILVGVKMNWTEGGVERNRKIAQVQQGNYTNTSEAVVPVANAFTRTFRTPYPQKILDGTNWTATRARQDPSDPNLPSDVMVYNHATTWTGIDIERWAYSFANRKHDDYVIMEYVFTNTSEDTKEGVLISLPAQLATSNSQPTDLWADYYGANYRQYVTGDTEADSMRMQYSWQGDKIGIPQDLRADPDRVWGHFQKPQYFGQVVIHADRASDDTRDDPTQPRKAGWAPWDFDLNLTEEGHEGTYDRMNRPWVQQLPKSYARTVTGEGEEKSRGMYRELRPGVDLTNFDTSTELAKTGIMVFGPYQLEPGEDVRVVTAFVGGSISPRLAIDAGRAYDSGFSELRERRPLPYDVYDTDGNLIAEEGDLLTRNQRDEILAIGKQRLFRHANRAIETWKRSDVQSGNGTFDIDYAPGSPSLTGTSLNERIRLEWGDQAANDTRAAPIAGYKIYRSYQRPEALPFPTDTTFIQVDSVGSDVREYVDDGVVVGEDYFYYISAVTEEGTESSPYLNRTGTGAERSRQALSPTRAPAENWQETVRAVPNPYHPQGATKYSGKRLNFINLPAYANIHIYTVAGDRVQTISHVGATGDEDWQRQATFSTMEIVSGVYYFVVEELDGPEGEPTGQVARGKFVVVK